MYFADKFFSISEPYLLFMDKLKFVLSEIEKSNGDDETIKKLSVEIKWLTGKFYDMVEHNLFDSVKLENNEKER